MNQTQHVTTSNVHLQTWVSREFKEHFSQIAKAQGLSESALLRRLLEKLVLADQSPDDVLITPVEDLPSTRRVSVRLRADDLLFLRERAMPRGLPTSTCRAHACSINDSASASICGNHCACTGAATWSHETRGVRYSFDLQQRRPVLTT